MKLMLTDNYSLIKKVFEYEISINNPFTQTVIIENNGELYGFMEYSIIYDRIEIDMIKVQEKYRNKKIGTKLMHFILQKSQEKKINNITLEVNQKNIAAISLYKKFGFEKKAVRKNYYKGTDAILMYKEVK